MANKNFYRTETGILINLSAIAAIEPRSVEEDENMLKMGMEKPRIDLIKKDAPYGKKIFTKKENCGRFKKAVLEPIGYYIVHMMATDGGGLSTYGLKIYITSEDYENITEILGI
jgi:hypothetical protein